MFNKQFICFFGVLLLMTISTSAVYLTNLQEQKTSQEAKDLTKLNSVDRAQLIEFLRLKKEFGSQVWPNFNEVEIPLILYNERYELLITHSIPPAPWIVVESDTFQENQYYRRRAVESQAFAVPVGDLWAGSLDTLDHMSRSMREQLQDKIPPEKLTPAMIKMMEITPAQHVVILLHEAFHAFQAMQNRDRFLRANDMYTYEKQYPFDDDVFKSAWNKEGSLLMAVLREKEAAERLELILGFIQLRKKRRSDASLSPELIAFECELEWLEGLGKYVEMRFSELGSSLPGEGVAKAYRIVRSRLQSDFSRRIRKLGDQHGDLRFYLSGAIQAMILDEISPGWKRNFIHDKNTSLEEMLQTASLSGAAAQEAKK